jgi:hypothetical protein
MLTNLYVSNIQMFNAKIDTQIMDATFGFFGGGDTYVKRNLN